MNATRLFIVKIVDMCSCLRLDSLILEDAPLLKDNYAIVALIEPRPVLVYQIGTHETRVLVDVAEHDSLESAMIYMKEVCLYIIMDSIYIFR